MTQPLYHQDHQQHHQQHNHQQHDQEHDHLGRVGAETATDPGDPWTALGEEDGWQLLLGLATLRESGQVLAGSVLAEQVAASAWFAEQVRAAAEVAWRRGFTTGRSQFRQATENPYQPDGGRPSLPFVP